MMMMMLLLLLLLLLVLLMMMMFGQYMYTYKPVHCNKPNRAHTICI
jgi:uncharacterized membrane protein